MLVFSFLVCQADIFFRFSTPIGRILQVVSNTIAPTLVFDFNKSFWAIALETFLISFCGMFCINDSTIDGRSKSWWFLAGTSIATATLAAAEVSARLFGLLVTIFSTVCFNHCPLASEATETSWWGLLFYIVPDHMWKFFSKNIMSQSKRIWNSNLLFSHFFFKFLK